MPSLTDGRTAHTAPMAGIGPDEIRGRDALNARVSGIDAILPNLSFTNLFVAASQASRSPRTGNRTDPVLIFPTRP
jgi:hypothetical protein